MQVLHNLGQALLGFVLARYIGEFDALGGFHIDLGIALAQTEHHGIGPSGLIHHLFGHELSEADEQDHRQSPGEQEIEHGEVSSMVSPRVETPASSRRWVSSVSGIIPVW